MVTRECRMHFNAEDFHVLRQVQTHSIHQRQHKVSVSAVLLPEVFLKALTLCRNVGYAVERFLTVNLDMIQHYRPEYNIVQHPTQHGGAGSTLIGHHEIMLTLLYAMILETLERKH